MKAVQIMTWYSCCYNNKRTLNILEEVALDDPDSASLFLFHWIYNYCRLNLISRRFFFHYFFKYLYIFSFSPHNHDGTYHWVDFIADIDECAQNTHNCSTDNATCTNTEGLFNCSCDPGFSGDGHNCAGVRIFQSVIAFPFQRVKHTWPDLLVHKNFKRVLLFFVSSMTQHLMNLIMTYVCLFNFLWLIKLSLLQFLHCILKPPYFYEIEYNRLISL